MPNFLQQFQAHATVLDSAYRPLTVVWPLPILLLARDRPDSMFEVLSWVREVTGSLNSSQTISI
jgi:hypothetical protein